MQEIRLAINGFGQIGKVFFRQVFDHPNFEVVALNDLGAPEDFPYTLQHDSHYGRFKHDVMLLDDELVICGFPKPAVKVFGERDPGKLPWKDLGIDIVVDASGVFDTVEKLMPHIRAGAKRVVLTAPAKDNMPMCTPNVGEAVLAYGCITSNASCTTNALLPLVKVLDGAVGIVKGTVNTTHAYTATQKLVDGIGGKKDPRRGRAAAMNICPAATGAAQAVGKILPKFAGKIDGISVRVPVSTGSLLDFTFMSYRHTSAKEINRILAEAAGRKEWEGILGIAYDPLVSSDIVGSPYGSLVQLDMTRVMDGNLVKVLAWYDNVWGYCAMLTKHVLAVAKYL